jgi:UDP-glucose 4-epimerase
MTVLVIGGAGYIGGHMVLGFLDSGEQPVVIDNMSNRVAWAVPPGVRFIVGDIGDDETVARVIAEHKIDAARLITPQHSAWEEKRYIQWRQGVSINDKIPIFGRKNPVS